MATTTNDKFQLTQAQINDVVAATGMSDAEIRKGLGECINSFSTFVKKHDCE
jgi:hypothetical protein